MVGNLIAISYLGMIWPLPVPNNAASRSRVRKYITFISLREANDIDFIRRYEECCTCWVVGDIGARIDLRAVEHRRAAYTLRLFDLAS
jgi:hypothetical protein